MLSCNFQANYSDSFYQKLPVISKHNSGYSPNSSSLLQVPAFTKFLRVLAEKDYTKKKKLFQISKEQFMSSLWFGQSFRSALYFTSTGSHIAVYDGNLNQGMLLEWLQPVWTHNAKNQAQRFVCSRGPTKHLYHVLNTGYLKGI